MEPRRIRSVLRHLDQQEVSDRAKVETRSREVYLPPVSVYRWWARRTETVSGALIDAAAAELPRERRLLVADPFAGGGVIPLAALRRGHAVYAQDLNPWVAKGLATMLSLPKAEQFAAGAAALVAAAEPLASRAYATTFADGSPAFTAHALRVAVSSCSKCGTQHRLFPHALVTLTKRKERGGAEAILACPSGHLFGGPHDRTSECPDCRRVTDPTSSYLPKRVARCPGCGHEETLEQRAGQGPFGWELVLVERSDGRRRELGFPTRGEIEQAEGPRWLPTRSLGEIPEAHETRVLRRHGFRHWEDLYPPRQRVVLETLLRLVRRQPGEPRLRAALQMAVLGTAEMAGLLSRWDRFYLKSYESMASHRFNFTTLAVEPNVLGVGGHGRGTLRGRLVLFQKAARWLHDQEVAVPTTKPLKSSERLFKKRPYRRALVVSGSSERMLLPTGAADLVLTDPPYHDDVQYHELSLPFRAWAKLDLARMEGEAVAIPHSAGLPGHAEYRGSLTTIFREFRRVLRPDGRLLFSYANREPAAWVNLFAALRASDFRPVGYSIVHSENESDHAKRKGRACNLDLILELTPAGSEAIETWRPEPLFQTDEEKYLLAVGDAFLQSGTLVNGWEAKLVGRLKSEIFVKEARSGAPQRAERAISEAGTPELQNSGPEMAAEAPAAEEICLRDTGEILAEIAAASVAGHAE